MKNFIKIRQKYLPAIAPTLGGLACLVAPYVASAAGVGTPLTAPLAVASLAEPPVSAEVASDAAGNFIVLWSPNQSGAAQPLSFQRFSSAGAPLTGLMTIPRSDGGRAQGILAMGDSGDFVTLIACPDPAVQGICVQLYTPAGLATGSAIPVATLPAATKYVTGQSIDSARVAMSASGDFVVAWSEHISFGKASGPLYLAGKNTVHTRAFSVDGQAKGPAKTIASQVTALNLGGRGTPVTALAMNAAGDYAVSWAAIGNEFKAQFFSADGAASSSIISIPRSIKPSYQNRDTVTVPGTLAVTDGGDVLIGWDVYDPAASDATDAVYLGRYSASGKLKDGPVKLLTRPEPSSLLAHGTGGLSLAATSSGGFVLTWGTFSSAENDGIHTDLAISSQAYAADDQVVGAPFAVATESFAFSAATDSLYPIVTSTVDSADNPLIVWGAITAQLFQGP